MLKRNKKAGSEPTVNMDFANIKFAGTFREYQQRAIENSAKYLKKDRRIHIVAAPGSGKTILGLELIRQLGKPSLILSPTIAIREQWKERFAEMFVPKNDNVDNYVSSTLAKPKLLTSITYQGLYTSYRRIASSRLTKPSEEGDDFDDAETENYSTINIIELMKEKQISTLCLDEAHHLRAEWQKALYEFVERVEHEVTIIALTATPPYDSKKNEWDKYTTMCGPIDEEIFVPELVRAKTLCPHQDFIYYNFPTANEIDIIENYKKTVDETVKEIFETGKFLEVIKGSEFYKDPDEFADELADRPELVNAIISFLVENKEQSPKQLRRVLERDERKVEWDLAVAETLFQGMLSDDQLFAQKDREYVKEVLSRAGLVEKNKVGLLTNSELEKLLFSSRGKLNSIGKIVEQEWATLGEKIRLLVLTDYIRVNSAVLGSDKEIKEMGVVPVFELIRRKNLEIKLAALSGKIVIVPNEAIEDIRKIADKEKAQMKVVAINNTNHSELKFEGANSVQKISVITKAFNQGAINGIVGTKSLLGEGWDSPVINTLILGSYVGSFMLSNQMRGRAIRVDKFVPEKVSNIWHLTAILPQHLLPDVNKEFMPSEDYATLKRRFSGFLGLSYTDDHIESGLQRALTLHAPYDEKNVEAANNESFNLAKDRSGTGKRWYIALQKSANEVLIQNEIIKPKKGFIPALILKPSHFATVKKGAYAIMKAFKDLNLVNRKAKAIVQKEYKSETVNVGISRCSQYEKSIFHQAVSEFFGAIDNPKYVLCKTKRNMKIDYRCSFAVPEIFSNRKENADVFRQRIVKRFKGLELYFTRSNDGKKHLTAAKKKAYVNKGDNAFAARMRLRPK